MKRDISLALAAPTVALVLAALAPPVMAAPAPAAPAVKGLEWVDTYEAATARAKKERKIVLLDFYTDWCGWCKRLDKDVFAQASFIQAADGVLGVKINAEKFPAIAQKFGANSYPRLFFVDPDGATLEQVRGYLTLEAFTDKVKAVKRGDTEYARARDAANDPMNLPAVHRFASMLAESGQHDKAIPYWQQVHDLALQQIFANPSSPQALLFHRESLVALGRGYAATGLPAAARQNFDEVLRQHPGTPQAGDSLVALAELEMIKGGGGQAKATPLLERAVREYAAMPAGRRAMAILQQVRSGAQQSKAGQ